MSYIDHKDPVTCLGDLLRVQAVVEAARELVNYESRTYSTSRYVKRLRDALNALDRSDLDGADG